jgi:hypothetical protein
VRRGANATSAPTFPRVGSQRRQAGGHSLYEWLVGRSHISQKSMATLSDPGSEKRLSLDQDNKEVELIAA